ncbi:hypothetical protein T05_8233 [Trichinella murrelli]|uniref:Uncharacterized protein n=1 Tax=Trichinella murrelli TaxID=144512 RepID=A0A0V0SRE6_9BILA|nr:hypothetical protein T05_8233 [Trichinella murrelli]
MLAGISDTGSLDKGAFHTENTGISQTPVSEIPASIGKT